MDKKFQEVKNFVTNPENRVTMITVATVIAVVAGITTFITKRGKAKQ